MEKFIAGIGFGMTCFFFAMGFMLGTTWLWGCAFGGALTGFGYMFMDEK